MKAGDIAKIVGAAVAVIALLITLTKGYSRLCSKLDLLEWRVGRVEDTLKALVTVTEQKTAEGGANADCEGRVLAERATHR